MPPRRYSPKTVLKICLAAVGATLLFLGADALATRYIGHETGEPCAKHSDCKGADAWCLTEKSTGARYCSHTCRADGACPASWSCASSGYKSVTKIGDTESLGTEVDVCWRTKPEAHASHPAH